MKTRIFSLFIALVLILAALAIPAAADDPVQGIELLGASIRTEGEQGLRFVGRIQKTGDITLTTGNDANFGILLIPETQLAANAQITKDTTDVMDVPAKILMGQTAVEAVGAVYDADYYYFSAVLTGIPAESYGTNLVARAYVNDNGTYSYSAQMKRSVQYVAQTIKTNLGGSAPAYIDTVLADYDAVGSDILVDAQNLSTLVTYPAYPAYISRDTLYTVSVSQGLSNKPLTVYNETADYSHFLYDSSSSRALGAMDSNRRFCEFAFDGAAVTVKIKVNKSFSTYTVSPTSKSFASTYANGVISVTLDQPEYFVLMLDNDYNTALAVFADAPETNVPAKGASNVVYVDTDGSITDPSNLITYAGANDEVIKISKNNAKIYIAPGAVLKKRVVFTRTDNDNTSYHCGISGRGMILDPYSDIAASNQNNIPTYTDMGNTQSLQGTVTFHGYGCTMEGVKVINSANYNVLFKQDYGHANHVKLLSTEMSSDGFTTTASKGSDPGSGWIENCFVYVGDNALVIQNGSDKTGYSFRNITIGTTCAAIYPQYNANTTLEDIYVFRADDGLINVGQSGVGSQTVNVTNLDALDCVKIPTLFKAWNTPGTATKTFNLNNVVMRYTTGSNGSFTPGTTTANKVSISNTNSSSNGYVLNLTNLYMGGQQVNGTCNYLMGNISNYYSNAYPTSNGITINFAVNGANLPAHTSVPVAQTANYTGGADVVAGPVRDWTRYQSYKCKVAKSGNAYTVTDSTGGESSQWGLSYNLTEYVKINGTGTYTVTFNTNKSVNWYVVMTSNTDGTTTTSQNGSGSSRTITITVNNVKDYTYQIVLKAPSTSTGSFTLNSSSFSKTA